MLELFWSIHNLGGEAPGGWHQVLDLKLVFERTSDGATQTVELSSHIAGFHAWYRMRGGMIPVLPTSRYLNLPAGEWTVYLDGTLQDVRALCLFADAFDDMFHYPIIQKFHAKTRAELLAIKHITDEDPAPLLPFHIAAGTLTRHPYRPFGSLTRCSSISASSTATSTSAQEPSAFSLRASSGSG